MREVLKKLELVQEIDTQIGGLLAKKAEFPKRLSGYDQEIKSHTEKLDERKKSADEIEKNLRQQVGAFELNEDRVKRSQEKLEQIKTNQEYQALLKEIESLKKNSAIIQENSNKVRDELAGQKKELDTIEAALTAVRTTREGDAAKMSDEEKGIDAELAKLNDQRREAIKGIDARYLAQYDRIRTNRYGVGIVAATGGSCKGCNMRIPPQIYNELQRGNEMHLCPSCRRILVYKEATNAASSASASAER